MWDRVTGTVLDSVTSARGRGPLAVASLLAAFSRGAGGAGEWWRSGGAGDEAHVNGGESPASCVGRDDERGTDGSGNGMTLVGAAGVVAGGDEGHLAV